MTPKLLCFRPYTCVVLILIITLSRPSSSQFWSVYVPCEAQYMNTVQLLLEQIDAIKRLLAASPKETTLVMASTGNCRGDARVTLGRSDTQRGRGNNQI